MGVQFTSHTAAAPPPRTVPVVASTTEHWLKHRRQWALSLPKGLHVLLCVMTAWACLGVSCGAIALAAEPHGPVLTCGLALLLGAMYALAALIGATWVEDDAGQRATAPLFVLLTIVAILMAPGLTGTHRAWLAVLAALQCACLLVASRPGRKLRRDFGWRGLKRVGASGSFKYGKWTLALRSRVQAPPTPRPPPRRTHPQSRA